MQVEIRADNSVHIEGYVNVAERESRPVATRYGKCNELIESGVFQRAIDSAERVNLMVDHQRTIGDTSENLELREDSIGLKAVLDTNDDEVVNSAKSGKIKGWSFGFRKPVDSLEQRADKLPLRRISSLILDEVSLIINKSPCYSATSVEVRADDEIEVEVRGIEEEVSVTDNSVSERADEEVEQKEVIDYSQFEDRINSLKGGQ